MLNKRKWGILLGIFAILVRMLFSWSPTACEYLYSRGVFQVIRVGYDYTLGWLPFPMVYVLFAWVMWGVYRVGRHIVRTFQRKFNEDEYRSWLQLGVSGTYSVLSFGGWIIFLFLFSWGYNYARIPLETQMRLDARPLEVEELKKEADFILAACIETRNQISQDTNALQPSDFPEDIETTMRTHLENVLEELNYPTIGAVRGRLLKPNGTLLRFGASGIYIPFVAEGHVEAALHISQHPFTLAHELGHGYGFGDEAVCNFLGYMACMDSDNPAVRYSGYLAYWRYVFSELRSIDNDYYKELRVRVPTGMDNDLDAVYAAGKRYPTFFPKLRDRAYDAYLKGQGVKEGVKSYSRMVTLVAALRRGE